MSKLRTSWLLLTKIAWFLFNSTEPRLRDGFEPENCQNLKYLENTMSLFKSRACLNFLENHLDFWKFPCDLQLSDFCAMREKLYSNPEASAFIASKGMVKWKVFPRWIQILQLVFSADCWKSRFTWIFTPDFQKFLCKTKGFRSIFSIINEQFRALSFYKNLSHNVTRNSALKLGITHVKWKIQRWILDHAYKTTNSALNLGSRM